MNPEKNVGILLSLTILGDFTKWQPIKETESVLFPSCPKDAYCNTLPMPIVKVMTDSCG